MKAVHYLPYCYHSVFINDILPEPKKRLFSWEAKVEGLMFADDIVVFARTADRLEELLDAISEWANTWEMLVGHAKCGVMLFGAARENANDLKRERMDSSRKTNSSS